MVFKSNFECLKFFQKWFLDSLGSWKRCSETQKTPPNPFYIIWEHFEWIWENRKKSCKMHFLRLISAISIKMIWCDVSFLFLFCFSVTLTKHKIAYFMKSNGMMWTNFCLHFFGTVKDGTFYCSKPRTWRKQIPILPARGNHLCKYIYKLN